MMIRIDARGLVLIRCRNVICFKGERQEGKEKKKKRRKEIGSNLNQDCVLSFFLCVLVHTLFKKGSRKSYLRPRTSFGRSMIPQANVIYFFFFPPPEI